MKFLVYSFFLLFLMPDLQAQIFPAGNLRVKVGEEYLKNPWAGGLDMPQFSLTNINNDALPDLVVFDSKASKWLIFINEEENGFIYAPQYETLFPEIINLGLIRDYNCDGQGDIFAHTNQGVQVFENTHQNGNPSFVLVDDLIEYQIGSGSNNIYKYNNDIIAIEDFDGDGDIDLLSFDLLGTTIPYYRNLSVEQGYGCDSLIFEENTVCWGNFREGSLDNSVELNFSCKGQGLEMEVNANRHTGSTLTVLDADEDGDQDLLLGDVSFNNLVYLENGGDNLDANMISAQTDFPTNDQAVNMPIFPASYYLDVDNDGLKDLLIAPNAPTAAVNRDCVWFYKNSGNAADRFKLQQKNFLVESMIDYGSNSFATFFDHNADGLLDLIVSNSFVYTEFGTARSNLVYYENTGSSTHPEFSLITENYQFVNNFNLEFVRPSFGDIDNDSDQDMIIGEINGGLHLLLNTAGSGETANFVLDQTNYFNIDIGTNSHPFLIDLNQDGLLDLVVGRNAPLGNVAYFRNFGTPEVPMFHPDTSNQALGNIAVANPGFLFGNSAPFVTEEDSFGKRYIYVGSDLGFIHKYEINMDSLESGSFVELEDHILETRAGRRTTVSIVDINNDGKNDYFIGNVRGGISFYSEERLDTTLTLGIHQKLEDQIDFKLYPNPANENLVIDLSGSGPSEAQIELIDMLGRSYYKIETNDERIDINVGHLNSGIFFVKVTHLGQISTKKVIIKN